MEITFKEKQQRAFDATKTNVCTVLDLPKGQGKSFWLFWTAYMHVMEEPGTTAIICAATFKEVTDTFRHYCQNIPDSMWVEATHRLLFENGSKIFLMSLGEPEKFKSVQGYVIAIDNADQITRREFDSAYQRLFGHGKVIVTRTHDPIYPDGTVFIK